MKTNLILVLISIFFSHGCVFGIDGSGKVATENRSVSKFTGIDLNCSANVYFSQGDEQSVKVEGEDNLISHITTEVKNDVLVVSTDGKDFSSNHPINIYVVVKDLCLLELSGSGNMIGKTHISCDHMTFRIAGSGDMTADIRALSIKVKISGSGSLDLGGTATSTDIRVAGSGNVDAKKLETVNTAVSITGSGQSTINATDVLTVNITGSGDVRYIGEPQKLKTNITGSGNVTKI